MVEADRLGHKSGKGWYAYPKEAKGKKALDPNAEALIARHRRDKGIVPRLAVSDKEVLDRCLCSLVNEAFKVLEEGVAAAPGDIDVIYVNGYGWPDYRGGPLFWADNEFGLNKVLATVRLYRRRFPNVKHWEPSPLLEALVASREPLAAWEKHKPKRRDGPASRL